MDDHFPPGEDAGDFRAVVQSLRDWTGRVVTVAISGFASTHAIPATLASASGKLRSRSEDDVFEEVIVQFEVGDAFWFAINHNIVWARWIDVPSAGRTLYIAQDGVQLCIGPHPG